MQDIPNIILLRFMERLGKSQVPASYHAEYLQWLRYYLDFCNRSPMSDSKTNRVRLHCEKLKSKKQTVDQLRRAAHAISLYFEILKTIMPPQSEATSSTVVGAASIELSPPSSAISAPPGPEPEFHPGQPTALSSGYWRQVTSPSPIPRNGTTSWNGRRPPFTLAFCGMLLRRGFAELPVFQQTFSHSLLPLQPVDN